MKSKGPVGPLLSDLHFVTSLQPEECISRLEELWRPGLTLDVEEGDAPDEQTFRLALLRDQEEVAEVKGRLRRWQGTRTRVDCSGMLAADQNVRPYAGGVLLLVVVLLAMSGALTDNPSLLCLSVMGVIFFLPLKPLGFEQSLYSLVVYDILGANRRGEEARKRAYREMDSLLQKVSSALATPDVEWVEPRRPAIAPPIRRHPLEADRPPAKPFLDDEFPSTGSPDQGGESF